MRLINYTAEYARMLNIGNITHKTHMLMNLVHKVSLKNIFVVGNAAGW